jgi:hypothetical protein
VLVTPLDDGRNLLRARREHYCVGTAGYRLGLGRVAMEAGVGRISDRFGADEAAQIFEEAPRSRILID